MKRLTKHIGRTVYWLGWPFYRWYFTWSERTRVLLVRGDQLLVVYSWLSDGRWGLPGGGLQRGEDPAEGVLRELKEEVGVVLPASALTLLGVETYRANGHRYVYHQFVAELVETTPITRQRLEIAEVQWVDYRTLTDKNAGPDVLLAIRKWRNLVQ